MGCLAHGYGRFAADGYNPHGAHQFSYRHFNGQIPDGFVVRHKCDLKCCVNPEHLEIGTQADNINDALLRGQIAVGSRVHSAKLTEKIVADARRRKIGPTQFAREAGIGAAAACQALKGQTWRHVA